MIGESSHHSEFSGTLSFSIKTLTHIFDDILNSLSQYKIKKLIIINGHGGNYPFLEEYFYHKSVKYEIYHDAIEKNIFKAQTFITDYSKEDLGIHAGLYETSLAMFTHPDCVRNSHLNYNLAHNKGPSIKSILQHGLKRYYPNGIIGNPQNRLLNLERFFIVTY